jgi:hypothetical protein
MNKLAVSECEREFMNEHMDELNLHDPASPDYLFPDN